MRDKLQKIFSSGLKVKNLRLYSSYGQETFAIISELNLSPPHNFAF